MNLLIPTLLVTLVATMAPAQSPVLLRTFNNPAPEGGDHFGTGLAVLGSDRILVGAPNYVGNPWPPTNAASVHLFHTNGTLLTTITKPPALGGEFGTSITTLGRDRIVIGSQYSHHVGIFSTNGSLVTVLTNLFQPLGPGVVAIGNDKLLIGSPNAYEDPDTWDTYGAAFLYSTNGTLLRTFYNPSPGTVSGFGYIVAAFGSDRVLIGASSGLLGAVYLFNTDGTLLLTITNPTPAALFFDVHPMAAVDTDRVLVGEPGYRTNTGVVRLFNTNGTLLLTITNPTPATEDLFGARITMLRNDRVVIGAPGDDTTGSYSGSAYVFSLNGTLLATINNPAPGVGDWFGSRLAAFGNDGVIIGAPWHNGVGSAYLFKISAPVVAPSLTIQFTSSNTVAVSWPSTATDFVLQQNTNGLSSVNWSNVTSYLQDNGTTKSHMVNPIGRNRFYRLATPVLPSR